MARAMFEADCPGCEGLWPHIGSTAERYRTMARAALPHASAPDPCGCSVLCGDDGDIDGPGTCRGLPPMPEPPSVVLTTVRR
jgi:hypothetical protein